MAAPQPHARSLVAASQSRACPSSAVSWGHHACPPSGFTAVPQVSRFCAHSLASSLSDETGPQTTCPLRGTLTPGCFRLQLSVASASSWPALPSGGTSSSSVVTSLPSHHLISMSARWRQHSRPCLSFLSPFDSLVRTTMSTQTQVPQHNNLTNTASTVTVSLSVYVRKLKRNVTVILRFVSSLVIDPSAPAKSVSRLAFRFTIPNNFKQISFKPFRDIHQPRKSDRHTTQLDPITQT